MPEAKGLDIYKESLLKVYNYLTSPNKFCRICDFDNKKLYLGSYQKKI